MSNLLGLINLVAVLVFSSCGQAPAQTVTTPQGVVEVTPVGIASPTASPDPEGAPTPSPTPAPTNSDNVVSFDFNNTTGICTALERFDPSTETIEVPLNIPCTLHEGHCPTVNPYYTFGLAGVTETDDSGTLPATAFNSGQDIVIVELTEGNPELRPACTITIHQGQLESVL